VREGECLAVGDSDSDVDMFARARIGVAVCPSSERVRGAADIVLEDGDLRGLVAAVAAMAPGWVPGRNGG
jgi:hydroxymethylpyrimidine pyrophosphatase-like HAD family hydrolase